MKTPLSSRLLWLVVGSAFLSAALGSLATVPDVPVWLLASGNALNAGLAAVAAILRVGDHRAHKAAPK